MSQRGGTRLVKESKELLYRPRDLSLIRSA